jgi:hypothetical protein
VQINLIGFRSNVYGQWTDLQHNVIQLEQTALHFHSLRKITQGTDEYAPASASHRAENENEGFREKPELIR